MSDHQQDRKTGGHRKKRADASECQRVLERFQADEEASNRRNLLFGDIPFRKPASPPERD